MVQRHYMLNKDQHYLQFSLTYESISPSAPIIEERSFMLNKTENNLEWTRLNEGKDTEYLRTCWRYYVHMGYQRVDQDLTKIVGQLIQR